MAKKRSTEDFSDDELRWMLVEKRRATRQKRLERYRRTGRTVVVAPEVEGSFDDLRTDRLGEDNADEAPASRSRRRRVLDGLLLLVEVSAVVGFIFVIFNNISVIISLLLH